MRHLAALLLAATLAGCAGMPTVDEVRQEASSGQIGCPPKEIAVSEHQRLTWTATCKGRVFYCTTGAGTSCTAALR